MQNPVATSGQVFNAVFGFPLFALATASLCALALPLRSPAAEPARDTFRVAFSAAMFSDVNPNDARAAVKGWAQTVARQRGIATDPAPSIITDLPGLSEALLSNRVDAVGITTEEYWTLSRSTPLNPVFIAGNGGRLRESFVVLVHRESGLKTLADLHERKLLVYQNPMASLAPHWLDTLLLEDGHPLAAEFLKEATSDTKLTRVVLPVFFKQSDACLVTRSGFDTMNELNPQLGRTLEVIATSPEFVPSVFCLRGSYAPPFKDNLLTGLRELHLTPAGQQVLTIFKIDRLVDEPASCLDSSLALLERRVHLLDKASSKAKSAAGETRKPMKETLP